MRATTGQVVPASTDSSASSPIPSESASRKQSIPQAAVVSTAPRASVEASPGDAAETAAAAQPPAMAPTRSGFRHVKTTLVPGDRPEGRSGAAGRGGGSQLLSVGGSTTVTPPGAGMVGAVAPGPTLRYRTDLDKPVIHFMFERLGRPVEEIFVPFRDEDERDANTGQGDWHFFWMSVSRIRNVFSTAEFRLHDHQIINHFPNHYELTRKDLMYKNIKRYLRDNSSSEGQRRLTLSLAADWVAAAGHGAAATTGSGPDGSPLLPGGGGSNGTSGKSASAFGSPHTYGTGVPSSVSVPSAHSPGRTTSFAFAQSVPITYNIPNDLSMFTEEFRRHPGATWIVKPTSRSQGKGIFLINRIQQLLRWVKEKKEVEADTMLGNPASPSSSPGGTGSPTSASPHSNLPQNTAGAAGAKQNGAAVSQAVVAAAAAAAERKQQEHLSNLMGAFIVSKYVANPLLIGGRKFDLRLYVLVTSYKPLVAYLHEEGFARFCATKYVGNSLSEDDLGSHLTNVALQKGDDHYNTSHGGKWLFKNLFLYIQGRYGAYAAEGLKASIKFLIYHSLRAMETAVFNDKHSFELYGYDILIDDDIRPHLIEVNASPSLSTTTTSDRFTKEEVLTDMLKIVLPPGYPSSKAMSYSEYRTRTDLTTQLQTGFTLLQF